MGDFAVKDESDGEWAAAAAHSVIDQTVNIASALPFGHDLTAPYYQGSGGASPHDLSVALGHYADEHPQSQVQPGADDLARFAKGVLVPTGGVSEAPHTRIAGYQVGAGYQHTLDDKGNPLPDVVAPEDAKLDLSTPEARLASLAQLTQNRQDYASGENTCAASSLVGGAILAQGTDGLKKLMDGMDANAGADDKKRLDEGDLKMLRDKIAKHQDLTNHDMHVLQEDLYQELLTEKPIVPGQINGEGVDPDTMAAFLAKAPAMDKLLRDNHMGVSTIDANGQGHAHAVLSIRNADPSSSSGDAAASDAAVYDPYARKGGQIVTDPGALAEYRLAEMAKKDGGSSFEQ